MKENTNYKIHDFVIGNRACNFQKKYFPKVTGEDWNNWQWQLRNCLQDFDTLSKIFQLTKSEINVLSSTEKYLPVKITPYYASLIDSNKPDHPIRRSVIPVDQEYIRSPQDRKDPLGEEDDSPVPGIVHRYPDRVLLLATYRCATYCRYCTRTRIVGHGEGIHDNPENWEAALQYIGSNTKVRDVLISGGDPLIFTDEKLEWLLSRLRQIPHVEFLRIGTKAPAVLPQRITQPLINMLKKYHPLWMSIHFIHPLELTPEVSQACNRLADAGIPLGSQTVLLAGINDSVEILKRLFQGLLKLRVRPYYLYQCDSVVGTSHFRTPVEKGMEIIDGLQGFTSGYAVPKFVVDIPEGGGKVPLMNSHIIRKKEEILYLKNYEGKVFAYTNPRYLIPRMVKVKRSF